MPTLSKYIIGIAIAAVILFLVWYFSSIVGYILISAVLAIIGKPMVNLLMSLKFKNRQLPKWVAAICTLATIWTLFIAFFVVFIPLIFEKVNELSTLEIPQIINSLNDPLSSLQNFIQKLFAIKDSDFSLTTSISTQLSEILNINAINHILGSIVTVIGNTAVALFSISFITFFFLKEDHLFFDMVVSIFPTKYEQNISRALNSITELLIRYFTGIVAESTIILFVTSIAMLIWGMDAKNAFFIGLIMGVLNVIPYIGPLIGAGISIFIGIISPIDGFTMVGTIMAIAGTILVIKGCDDFILQPSLYSNRAKAHPLEIFIVILIAGSVAGVLGMLLAIPSYNVIRVFAKEFFNNFKLVQKLTEKI